MVLLKQDIFLHADISLRGNNIHLMSAPEGNS